MLNTWVDWKGGGGPLGRPFARRAQRSWPTSVKFSVGSCEMEVTVSS